MSAANPFYKAFNPKLSYPQRPLYPSLEEFAAYIHPVNKNGQLKGTGEMTYKQLAYYNYMQNYRIYNKISKKQQKIFDASWLVD